MKGILSLILVLSPVLSAWMNPPEQTGYSPYLVPGPNAIVYQLNGPWENLVPITLSADGNNILAYPAPADVKNMRAPNSSLIKDGGSIHTAFHPIRHFSIIPLMRIQP